MEPQTNRQTTLHCDLHCAGKLLHSEVVGPEQNLPYRIRLHGTDAYLTIFIDRPQLERLCSQIGFALQDADQFNEHDIGEPVAILECPRCGGQELQALPENIYGCKACTHAFRG